MLYKVTGIKKSIKVSGRYKNRYECQDENGITTEILLGESFPFSAGTLFDGNVSGDVSKPENIGDDYKNEWNEYYKSRILSLDRVDTFASEEEKDRYETYLKLLDVGVSSKTALEMIDIYALDLLKDKCQNDPFWLYRNAKDSTIRLLSSISKLAVIDTFEKEISMIKSYIYLLLSSNEQNYGHTYAYVDKLHEYINSLLINHGHEPISKALLTAVLNSSVMEFYYDGKRCAFLSTYETEHEIKKNIEVLKDGDPVFMNDIYIPDFLVEEQKDAVKNIVNGGNICILTGGPGTGKTTTEATIIKNYYTGNEDIAVIAPTGRAAWRAKESLSAILSEEEMSNINIATVDKFLGMGLPEFKKADALRAIKNYRLILIDESSMLDIFKFAKLLDHISCANTKVVLVGDVHQLPAISAGNVLTDLIKNGVATSILTENHRSAGSIKRNAEIINEDKPDDFVCDEHFMFIPKEAQGERLNHLNLADENIMLLTPYKKPFTKTGKKLRGNSTDINNYIHKRLFAGSNRFEVGDKVVALKNNYKQGYFNGDIGYITAITEDDIICEIRDADGIRTVTVKDEDEIDYGYACTVHKAQGCEADKVILVIPDEKSEILSRELIYTAMTRAKNSLEVWGTPAALRNAAKVKAGKRQTFLGDEGDEKNLVITEGRSIESNEQEQEQDLTPEPEEEIER